MSIFTRARTYATLTPGERALLRLLEGLGAVALLRAATACAQYLGSQPGAGLGAVDWPAIVRVCVAGAAVAVLLALAKYFKAHGDPVLADALAQVGAEVASETTGDAAPPGPRTPVVLPPAETGAEGTMSL